MKRVLFISDTHCGNLYGLTSPNYWRKDIEHLQSALWNWFTNTLQIIKESGKIDVCVHAGDCVDGKNKKNKGIDSLDIDISKQIDMADDVFHAVDAAQSFIVGGTPYHTIGDTDYEYLLADKTGASLHDDLTLNVNGLLMHVKHHAKQSSTPHGQGANNLTAVWGYINRTMAKKEPYDVEVRGHTHGAYMVETPYSVLEILPCLVYPFAKYGRKFETNYRMGLRVWDVESKTEYQRMKYDFNITPYKPEDVIV